jgi:hypothetical protein
MTNCESSQSWVVNIWRHTMTSPIFYVFMLVKRAPTLSGKFIYFYITDCLLAIWSEFLYSSAAIRFLKWAQGMQLLEDVLESKSVANNKADFDAIWHHYHGD